MTTDTTERTLQHRIGPDGLLVVRLHDGEARVRGTNGDTATVRSLDGALLDGIEVETGERSLSIRARRGPDFLGIGRRAGRTTELDIEVPVGATVVIEASSADLDAEGLRGDQRYRSASGDVVLRDVSGSIAADTVSGDLEIIATGAATLAVRTVSGDLSLRAGSIGELRATTTSGDLFVAGLFDGAGPYSIETVSGDLVLAPANDIRVEVGTITGDLTDDVGARRDDDGNRRALVMGRGGPTIGFRSASGDLHLARSKPFETGAPTAPTSPTQPTQPTPPTPPTAPTPPASPTVVLASETTPLDDTIENASFEILRALERGEIDVAEARRRLETLDAGADASDQLEPSDA